jgi:hypothetical protein
LGEKGRGSDPPSKSATVKENACITRKEFIKEGDVNDCDMIIERERDR